MREIKFRAKDRVGVWVYGDLRLTSREPHIWTDPYTSHIINTKTIGQYTGLKDKNDKEIYEGDIVKSISGKIGYVIFLQQEMGYVVVWDNCDTRLGHRSRGGRYDVDSSIEVIGNIYDNPELVEE
ncbi:MAG: hypothetical protein IJD91_06160 [Clostridia bacterium]|nr:hypothetical protein [Clostridia bacterium]